MSFIRYLLPSWASLSSKYRLLIHPHVGRFSFVSVSVSVIEHLTLSFNIPQDSLTTFHFWLVFCMVFRTLVDLVILPLAIILIGHFLSSLQWGYAPCQKAGLVYCIEWSCRVHIHLSTCNHIS
ncbi:uncharacterized protein BDV14DRAFT_131690 [Aspergillus stella-maris]|uniref:uncharacterized protein n=1 Tax=Aspergillus stella-maris TaxID=1810926 RepID=UPI003CCCE6B1